ncbi:hypothetical protein MMPV_009385 [Pyropia vietnamensis]
MPTAATRPGATAAAEATTTTATAAAAAAAAVSADGGGGGGGGKVADASGGVVWAPITAGSVAQLRELNAALFPVAYDAAFYRGVLAAPPGGSKAPDNGAGTPGAASPTRLYIMTLGVAAAYRERGLGSALIRHVMDLAVAHGGVSEVYLHVHVPNVEAIRLYSRHGFEIASRLRGYYRRIEPPDCYYVRYLL